MGEPAVCSCSAGRPRPNPRSQPACLLRQHAPAAAALPRLAQEQRVRRVQASRLLWRRGGRALGRAPAAGAGAGAAGLAKQRRAARAECRSAHAAGVQRAVGISLGQQGGRCSGAACRRRRQRQRGNRRRRPPHPTCSTPPELGGQLVLHAGRHPVAQQRELRHLRSGWEAWVSRGRGRQSSCTAGAALHQGWLAFQPLLLVTKRCTCRSRLPARTWRACAPAAAERLNSPNTAPGSSSDPSLHSTSSSSSSSSSSSPSDPSASDSDSSSSPIARGPSSSSATRARRAAAAAASSPLLAPRLRSSSESGPAGSAACWCGR